MPGPAADGKTDPAKPHEELLSHLAEAIALVRAFLDDRNASLDDVIQKTGFARNAAIVACKEAANDNDETRKRFEMMCREVFKKFKACINIQRINEYRSDRDAINIVSAGTGGGNGKTDPAKPHEELLSHLAEAIALVRAFLDDRNASLDDVIQKTGFARNAAIVACKEAANDNDETRKRFEMMCREVFKKFKACINIQRINEYRSDRDAINIVYKSLQHDREQADIADIIQQLHAVIDDAIETTHDQRREDTTPYDISRIDFDLLKREFKRSPKKKTTVQNLRQALEQRLRRMLAQNPLRTDFQQHYEEIVAEYNREKDRVTIEKTFEDLLRFTETLDEEEERAVREGLDMESLAIFDLLKKPELQASDITKIKSIAVDLLALLKAEKLRIDQWRDKEATRDAVKLAIRDFLYGDEQGLPVTCYSEQEVMERAGNVFRHVYRAYPTLPSPCYQDAAVA